MAERLPVKELGTGSNPVWSARPQPGPNLGGSHRYEAGVLARSYNGSTLDFGSSRCWFESSPGSHCSLAQLAVASASGAEGSKFESWVSSGNAETHNLGAVPSRAWQGAHLGQARAATCADAEARSVERIGRATGPSNRNLRVRAPHGLQGDTDLRVWTQDAGPDAQLDPPG